MVQTVADGRVWVFAALDHFNSEVGGHYVSTDGSRFAALEPADGKYKGRPASIDPAEIRRLTATMGPTAIAKHLGVARSTVYRLLGHVAASTKP